VTRNELHVLARQAMRDTNTNGDDTLTPWMVRFVERFGQLVAEEEREACVKEREACAKVAEGYWRWQYCDEAVREIAAEIRARGGQ
jgi:hypothetical protein